MKAPMSRAGGPLPGVPQQQQHQQQRVPPSNEKIKEDAVVKLAELLSKEQHNKDIATEATRAKNIKQFFSPNLPQNNVVLVLPSLDIQLAETSALPNVGETSNLPTSNSNPSMAQMAANNTYSQSMKNDDPVSLSSTPQQRPTMTASVLNSATKDAANAEHEVAKSLGETTSWTKSTVAYAPAALVNNVADSFSRLVDSRMKAWTLLLLRHSLSTGDESSRKRLLGILSASLKVESVFTKFRTLPLPDSAKVHAKEADVILPLLFEASVTVTGLEDKAGDNTVTLRAPGTIAADFMNIPVGIWMKEVKINLDCSALLSSMVEQARIQVLKAVAAATKTHVPTTPTTTTPVVAGKPVGISSIVAAKPGTSTPYSHQQMQMQQQQSPSDASPAMAATPLMSTSKSLASFRSALDLTPRTTDSSPPLRKARDSALRLNSILQGRKDQTSSSQAGLGMRKTRSIRWDTPGELPTLNRPQDADSSAAKKARNNVQAAAKLKSFKSFGRPHAGDFGSGPRNATFGEFGGRSTTGMWGRDGRMAAHPTPMKDATLRDPLSGEFQVADKNATFNMAQATRNLHSKARIHGASSNNRPSIHLASGGGSANMPRTATVLETLLLKRSMN